MDPVPSPMPHSATNSFVSSHMDGVIDDITIELSNGVDLVARPYEHSVSGHHIMLSQAGLIWKATRSKREKRFYDLVTASLAWPPEKTRWEEAHAQLSTACNSNGGVEGVGGRTLRQSGAATAADRYEEGGDAAVEAVGGDLPPESVVAKRGWTAALKANYKLVYESPIVSLNGDVLVSDAAAARQIVEECKHLRDRLEQDRSLRDAAASGGGSNQSPFQERHEVEVQTMAHMKALCDSRNINVDNIITLNRLRKSAFALSQYLPAYFGCRQVAWLRCHDDMASSEALSTTSSNIAEVSHSSPNTAGVSHAGDSLALHSEQANAASSSPACPSEMGSAAFSPTSARENVARRVVEQFTQDMYAEAMEKAGREERQAKAQRAAIQQRPASPASIPAMPSENVGRSGVTSSTHVASRVTAPFADPSSRPPLSSRLSSSRAQLDEELNKALPSRSGEQSVDMILLEDVCYGLRLPCVLDLKMGTRQFGLNAGEEKQRSKEAKAAKTTTGQYGVRLAGMKLWDSATSAFIVRGKMDGRDMSIEALGETLNTFVDGSRRLKMAFHERLTGLREVFASQRDFRFYTSSLLFVYDAKNPLKTTRIVLIDFAYTYLYEELVRANDREAPLEHDIGYIKAIDTLLSLLA